LFSQSASQTANVPEPVGQKLAPLAFVQRAAVITAARCKTCCPLKIEDGGDKDFTKKYNQILKDTALI
jgi:hypothetical protein